jgi:hypothetical protein
VLGEQAAQQHLRMQRLAASCMFPGARPSWIARPSCLPVGGMHSVRLLSVVGARSSKPCRVIDGPAAFADEGYQIARRRRARDGRHPANALSP